MIAVSLESRFEVCFDPADRTPSKERVLECTHVPCRSARTIIKLLKYNASKKVCACMHVYVLIRTLAYTETRMALHVHIDSLPCLPPYLFHGCFQHLEASSRVTSIGMSVN